MSDPFEHGIDHVVAAAGAIFTRTGIGDPYPTGVPSSPTSASRRRP